MIGYHGMRIYLNFTQRFFHARWGCFYLLDIEIMIVAIDSKLHSNNRFRWFKRVTDTRQGHYTNNRQND